ncbi:LytR/AlgR family response regulator transcription factor [Siphonobacter sp.]|uniref:LytR/AlgR family response regulator transcription factor n=1 Tax=Siphonobacter sp. TaxID=1869184 RepID=UPI003B3A5445
MNTSLLSCLIIEDEQANVNRLIRLLQSLRPNHQVLAVLGTVSESVAWLKTQPKPPLIFMDIRLADGICFDIFSQVPVSSPIVFTTAYDEYLMMAFKVTSIDYLLKPIDADELAQALDKFDQLHPTQPTTDPATLYAEFLALYQKQMKPSRQRFLLPYRDGYTTLLVEDIEFFFSEAKLTFAHTKSGDKTMIPHTLEELEIDLNPQHFFRANRQYIIHVGSIRSIHNYFNGKLKVQIGTYEPLDIIISKDKAPSFKHWLNQ